MSGTGWAGGRNRTKGSAPETGKDKEVPAGFNKTFQWEEREVGPKNKGVDHDKIAAMQAEERRQDAAKKRDEMAGGRKKEARAEGINGPATATLPTMDIEKPAPAGSVRSPMKKASYTPPPRQHDALDNLLAENGVGDSSSGSSEGLGSVLGGPSHKAAPAKHATHARAKKHARAHRRR